MGALTHLRRVADAGLERVSKPAAVGAAAVALTLVVFLAPSFRAPAAEMDEGTLLVYPERVLEGDVPHRDFETFYGPGTPWLLAAVFSATGPSLDVERAVGLTYRIAIVLAVFTLALASGLAAALGGALLAGVILLPAGVNAVAIQAAIAFALLGLAAGACGLAARDERTTRRWFLAAGIGSGLALLFRFDLALAVVLGAAPMLVAAPRKARLRYALGVLGGAAAYIPHLAIVGRDRIEKNLDDLIDSGPGRELPIPPLSTDAGRLFAAIIAAVALLIAAGLLLRGWRCREPEGRALLASGLFAAGLLPYALFRADVPHFLPVAVVPLGMLPALVATTARRVRTGRAAGVAAPLIAAALVAGLVAPSILRAGIDRQARLLVRADESGSHEVRFRGRSFLIGSEDDARAAEEVLAEADRLTGQGDRLFVGQSNLREANYLDSYLYFLLPKLDPASFYMELNPSTANADDSGLADEIANADVVILTSRWDWWDEPNASRQLGSEGPGDVLNRSFCERGVFGPFQLFERCRG